MSVSVGGQYEVSEQMGERERERSRHRLGGESVKKTDLDWCVIV